MEEVPVSVVLFLNVLLGTFSFAIVVLTVLFAGTEIYDRIQKHHGIEKELRETKEKLQPLEWENRDLERKNQELESEVRQMKSREELKLH